MPWFPLGARLLRVRQDWRPWVVGLAVSVAALVLNVALWRRTNPDTDTAFIPWYEYIVSHGGIHALADGFSNYNPPYLYLLTAATYLRPALSPLAAVKVIAILGEFAAAVAMYRLVRLRFPTGWMPWAAYAAVLFAPTVLLNGAVWGQSDAILTACLLCCVYSACRDRPLATVVWFTVAFSIKLQAVFLGPFLLLLFVERRIPWRYALAAPVVYAFMLVPAALVGRPLGALATIYVQQAIWVPDDGRPLLTLNAPTVYVFITNAYYGIAHRVGMTAAVVASFALAFSGRLWRRPLDAEGLVRSATLSAALVPFLLPAMHERYFYSADLLSITQGFYVPSLAPVALAFQVTSGLAYRVFLFRLYTPFKGLALLNGLVIAILAWDYRRYASTTPFRPPNDTSPRIPAAGSRSSTVPLVE